jgi:DNA-binding protein HU-beta
LNRTELIARVAAKAGLPRYKTRLVLDALADVMTEAVHDGERVSLIGVLSVERVERIPRVGRNPRTGDPIWIPAGYSVRVTWGSRLKAAVRDTRRPV